MVSALQFEGWEWLALALATPVVLWGGWPFHLATWTHLKHRAATMDTLITVGVLAAWLWSVYAVIAGDADTYLETASVITTFVLAGRYAEARARRRAGAALKALLELGAKEVAVVDANGAERLVPVDELQPGDRFVVRPGREGRHGRRGGAGLLGDRHEHAHGRVDARRGEPRARSWPARP